MVIDAECKDLGVSKLGRLKGFSGLNFIGVVPNKLQFYRLFSFIQLYLLRITHLIFGTQKIACNIFQFLSFWRNVCYQIRLKSVNIITHRNMISGVVNSFASVTIIRILSRILEFFLRVYLIRQVLSPQILAQMVALDLILTTSLHLTKSCLRPSYQQVESKISSMNLMSFGIIATLVSAVIVIFLQWHHKIQLIYVNQAILLYGFCALLEAFKQKYSVQFVLGYQYRKIALIQLVSYLPKTLVLFIAAKTGLFQQYGILVFGVGQLVYYGMCLFLTFFLTNYKILFIQPLSTEAPKKDYIYLDSKTRKVLKQLSYISILKLFLQQFQKIVLVVNNQVTDSSIYSLVSNLGSIVVRFLFAPLEQIAYNYYARGTEEESKKTLITLVKFINIFGCVCIGFGIRYGQNVLYMLYGEKWVNNQSILGFQCFMFLVAIIGLNGTIDSFVIARADPVITIPKLKYYTVLTTFFYFGSSFLLLHFGFGYFQIYSRAAGLFLGNAIGMLTRIVINWNIEVKKHISLTQFLTKVFPNLAFMITLLLSLFISYFVRQKMRELSYWLDFGLGAVLFGLCLLPLAYEYRNQIIKLMEQKLLKNKKQN